MATGAIGTSSLDVNSIVTQLMNVERQPLQVMTQRETAVTNRIAAFARVQGAISTLQTTASRLADTGTFTSVRSAVGGDGLTAAVTDATKASPSTYSIKVTTLASTQALASSTFTGASEALSNGTLRLQVGSGTAKDITIDSSNNTLAGVRDAINAADAGVTASIVSDGGLVRLTLLAKDSGASNTIKLTVQEDGTTFGDADNLDTTGLSRLAFDSSIAVTPPATTAPGRNMTVTRAAADAAFEVNGLALTSSTNTISNVIDGVTLDLKKADASNVTTVTVARDSSTAKNAVNDFIKAYNDLEKVLKDVTAYDAENKKAAVLNGDATVRSVQSQVRGLLSSGMTAASGDYSRLSEIGVEVTRDGTLTLNSTKFETAAADPAKLSRLFASTSDTDAARGFGVRFKNLGDGLIGSSGVVPSRSKGLQSQIEGIKKEEERLNTRLVATEARLRKQYTALDVQLQRLQSQSDSLANALSQLPKIGS